MMKLFLTEWIKLRNYRAFHILTGLYFLVVAVVCCSGVLFLEYLKNQGANFQGIDPTIIPIYHFSDIWPNITFIAARLKIILAFIVIISITNEITYKTLRQNIIDGLNCVDFMGSKLSMIFMFSLINTLFIIVLGMIMGFVYSQDTSLNVIFTNFQFLVAFFLNIFAFLVFTFLVALIIKRTGIVIIFLGIYATFVEPFATLLMTEVPQLKHGIGIIAPYFPVKAIRDLIPMPFPKYIFQEIQEYISFTEVSVVLVQLILYISLIYMLLKWRNK